MTQFAADAAPPRAERPPWSAFVFFVVEVGLWVVWVALAVSWPETLESIWSWIRDLPLVVEGVVWLLAFPWVLGLAVWHSAWDEWVRVLLVGCFAVGWSIAFYPHRRWVRPKPAERGSHAGRPSAVA
jgi:hypothetical protein